MQVGFKSCWVNPFLEGVARPTTTLNRSGQSFGDEGTARKEHPARRKRTEMCDYEYACEAGVFYSNLIVLFVPYNKLISSCFGSDHESQIPERRNNAKWAPNTIHNHGKSQNERDTHNNQNGTYLLDSLPFTRDKPDHFFMLGSEGLGILARETVGRSPVFCPWVRTTWFKKTNSLLHTPKLFLMIRDKYHH